MSPLPAQTVLPRWRGFNLPYMIGFGRGGEFLEEDFRFAAEWGFNFIRLPLSYRYWTDTSDFTKADESVLERIDHAVTMGQKYGLHVCVNLHRAPGFSVSREFEEPFNLWKDDEALEAFCFQWRLFAKRYRGIPSERVSFNLVNEPKGESELMSRADHERVIRAAVGRIREIDPARLIIIDGITWGSTPLPELTDLGVAQSCRAYWPHAISHHNARGASADAAVPVWPGVLVDGKSWDRAVLEERYRPFVELAREGVGVHCGEGGCFNRTPHEIFLAWYRDVLEILTEHNIGHALWNLRGPFGVLDSDRTDVNYEDWHGHKLDRKLLMLLQAF